MMIQTKDIRQNAMMVNGERVIKAERSGAFRYGNPKMMVTLESPTGRVRTAYWNYFGTVSVRSN